MEKWRVQQKRKEGKVENEEEKEKKKKKKKVRYRKGKAEEVQGAQSETNLGGIAEVAIFLMILEQNWLSVSAAAEGPQRKTEAVIRMQQEVRNKESSWTEAVPIRWKRPEGEDRTEMQKAARRLRCTLLKGSTWSTERYLLWKRAHIEEGGY